MHEEKREFAYVPGLFGEGVLEELRGHGKEYMRLMSYYASAMLEIETKFKVLSIEFNGKFDRNPIESIKTRLKTPQSIIEKMNRIGKPVNVESIEKELIAGTPIDEIPIQEKSKYTQSMLLDGIKAALSKAVVEE